MGTGLDFRILIFSQQAPDYPGEVAAMAERAPVKEVSGYRELVRIQAEGRIARILRHDIAQVGGILFFPNTKWGVGSRLREQALGSLRIGRSTVERRGGEWLHRREGKAVG